MDIQMVVTDLDNTLLRSDLSISDFTADVFRQLKERGIKVVFATARPARRVTPYFSRIEPDAAVCHNGAVTLIGGQPVFRNAIRPRTVKQIFSQLIGTYPDVQLSVEIGDLVYANFDLSAEMVGALPIRTDYSDFPETEVNMMIIELAGDLDIEKVRAVLPEGLNMQMAEGKLVHITNSGASKWNAAENLARYFGIPRSAVAAFGDDFNDIPMIRNAGVGIAVGNAAAEIQAAADGICASCDDDGVAVWLAENLKQ